MLISFLVFVTTIIVAGVITLLLWLLNYVFDGTDLISWLEQGAWKIPAFGCAAAVVGSVMYAFKSDADWEALGRRSAKRPKLLRKAQAYPSLPGVTCIGESIYASVITATEQGLILRLPWKQAKFLPWDGIKEIRVDWTTHSGKVAELHLPNYDAPPFVVEVPWGPAISWWVPERTIVWNRGEPANED